MLQLEARLCAGDAKLEATNDRCGVSSTSSSLLLPPIVFIASAQALKRSLCPFPPSPPTSNHTHTHAPTAGWRVWKTRSMPYWRTYSVARASDSSRDRGTVPKPSCLAPFKNRVFIIGMTGLPLSPRIATIQRGDDGAFCRWDTSPAGLNLTCSFPHFARIRSPLHFRALAPYPIVLKEARTCAIRDSCLHPAGCYDIQNGDSGCYDIKNGDVSPQLCNSWRILCSVWMSSTSLASEVACPGTPNRGSQLRPSPLPPLPAICCPHSVPSPPSDALSCTVHSAGSVAALRSLVFMAAGSLVGREGGFY